MLGGCVTYHLSFNKYEIDCIGECGFKVVQLGNHITLLIEAIFRLLMVQGPWV